MDPKCFSTGRLFREHCSFINGVFVKDMSQLGRLEKDVIIIDNSPTAYMLQPECALPILSWYNDMNDTYLKKYIPLLIDLSKLNDVRDAIPHFCRNNVIEMDLARQVCNQIFMKFDNKRMPQYRETNKKEPLQIVEKPRAPQRKISENSRQSSSHDEPKDDTEM